MEDRNSHGQDHPVWLHKVSYMDKIILVKKMNYGLENPQCISLFHELLWILDKSQIFWHQQPETPEIWKANTSD